MSTLEVNSLKTGTTNTYYNQKANVGGIRAGPTGTRSRMGAGATSRAN